MANADIITGFLGTLKTLIGADGRIPEENMAEATTLVNNISSVANINMGIDAFGVVTVEGVSYDVPDNLDEAVEAASQDSILSNYFDGSETEYGVISDAASVQTLITQIQAATKLDFTYVSEGTVHHIINKNFCIDIYEYDSTANPVQYADVVLRCGPLQNFQVSVFGYDTRETLTSAYYVAYQLAKSPTGDMLMKGYVTADNTPIDPDQGEEMFASVGYAAYTIKEVDGVDILKHDNFEYGGFIVMQMQYKGPNLLDNAEADESWAFGLMGTRGAPIYVGNSYSEGITSEYCHNAWLTHTSTSFPADDKLHLANIYAPSCGLVASRNARWAVMTNREGVHEITYGGGTYRYDHGFCIKVL